MKFCKFIEEETKFSPKKSQKHSVDRYTRCQSNDLDVTISMATELASALVDNKNIFGFKCDINGSCGVFKWDKNNEYFVEYLYPPSEKSIVKYGKMSLREYNSNKSFMYLDEI